MARVFTTEGKVYDVPYETNDAGLSDKDVISIAQSLKIPEGHFIVRIEGEKEARIAQFPSASAAASSAPPPPLASSPAARFAAPPPKAPAAMIFETNGELPNRHDKEWHPVVCRNLAHQMAELYGDPVTALAWVERHADDWAYTVEYTNKQDGQKYPHTIGNIKNGVREALKALAAEGTVSSKGPEAVEYRKSDNGAVADNPSKTRTGDISLLMGKPFEKKELEELFTKLKASPSKDALEELKKTYPRSLIDALQDKLKKDKNYVLAEADIEKFRKSHFRFLSEDDISRMRTAKKDPVAQFLICIWDAKGATDLFKCLRNSSIPHMMGKDEVEDWEKHPEKPIDVGGSKKIIEDMKMDDVIVGILERNGKAGGTMANTFLQISRAIRWANDPKWIKARIKRLVPKDGVNREDLASQMKYDVELRTVLAELEKPEFSDKTKLTPAKVQMITRIMRAYFKDRPHLKIDWDDNKTYGAIAYYKNVTAAYTHSINGATK